MIKNKFKDVPFFDYPSVYKRHKKEFLRIFNDVCSKGAFIMQSELLDFEKNLANYTNSKYAIGVANATDGLQMLLLAAGIKPYDEVIISSHTMIATAGAVHFSGGIPVPINAGKDHLIDVEEIESAITSKTKAIMPTQLNGRVADMDSITKIARKYDLMIFEDSAQALGAKYKGVSAGNFGLGGCISFYPAKVLGCFGDGGAVICNDDEIYEKLILLRDHGRGKSSDVEIWGLNSRLDNLQAAFLNFGLSQYEKAINRRRAIAKIYDERLGTLDEIVIPPTQNGDLNHFDIYQNYEIEANDRDNLKSFLKENGVGTLVQWGGFPIHSFEKLGFTKQLEHTEKLFKKLLMLPLNLTVTDNDIHYVCDMIKKFYQ